jgi:hypothetical protein
MRTSDMHKAIRRRTQSPREQGLEIPIDPTGGGSNGQGLMLWGPEAGQSVILSSDSVETAGYRVLDLPGRRLAATDCSKSTRTRDRFGRTFAGTVCLTIPVRPFPIPSYIPSRNDSPSCRKCGSSSPTSLELRG